MKLTITHLKAPWPAGAVVGGVIELASVPSWGVGKCEPAEDDAAVTVGVKPAVAAAESELSIEDLRAQAAALGMKVDGRWSRDRLADEIKKAQG